MRSFLHFCLAPIFLLMTAAVGFILPVTENVTRIAIGGSTLIAMVTYHTNLDSINIGIGRLTKIDQFMIVVYTLLLLSVLISITVMMLEMKVKKILRKFSKIEIKLFKFSENL